MKQAKNILFGLIIYVLNVYVSTGALKDLQNRGMRILILSKFYFIDGSDLGMAFC